MRRASCVCEDAWPIDKPQRIGGGVAAGSGIVMPMAVVGQPMFELEPLARQAEVLRDRAGDAVDAAEGLVDRRPDSGLGGVGEHHRAVQMIGVDGVDLLRRRRRVDGDR